MIRSLATDDVWRRWIAEKTGCKNPAKVEVVQSLWSGFGRIIRVSAGAEQFIVKQVVPADISNHPRGWSSDFSTARKIKSYAIEIHWYRDHSHVCDDTCTVPKYHHSWTDRQNSVLILEDLDRSGFPYRYQSLSLEQAVSCTQWLANFHARFVGSELQDLWPEGTYWHLATRPDEYTALESGPLKLHAQHIDRILSRCHYQTVVHGDAKVANFCFASDKRVAAVDFQYTGGGCGIKDLAYFIGSCFNEDECSEFADTLLDRYFETLTAALSHEGLGAEIEREWRPLYPVAWTDFYRFLAGWMPAHKKIHRYTRLMAEQTYSLLGINI